MRAHSYSGRALCRRRADAGLTQRQLAAATGLTQARVSRLELGKGVALSTLLELADVARALGITPGELVNECVRQVRP